MIHHCKDDGAVLVHFALNGKYWCPKCKLFRTRAEVAFVKGGLYDAVKAPTVPIQNLPQSAEGHALPDLRGCLGMPTDVA